MGLALFVFLGDCADVTIMRVEVIPAEARAFLESVKMPYTEKHRQELFSIIVTGARILEE